MKTTLHEDIQYIYHPGYASGHVDWLPERLSCPLGFSRDFPAKIHDFTGHIINPLFAKLAGSRGRDIIGQVLSFLGAFVCLGP